MRFLAFVLLLTACAPVTATRSQAETGTFRSPEALARHAFEALRAGDEYAWGRALATDEELGELVAAMGAASSSLADRVKEERDHAAYAFREIRESVGDWSGVTLEKVDAPTGTSGGAEGSDVTVSFARGAERFAVRLDDCMKAKRGWVIGGTPRLERL